jgi:CheY-like chemotaxis protein
MPAPNQTLPTHEPTPPSKRLLVVEDESLIALLIADQLVELGYTVVGPAFTISQALRLAQGASIDAALLDLNLDGVFTGEVADILSRRQIPLLFITGYGQPPTGRYQTADVLRKPFVLNDLRHAVEGMLAKLSGDIRAAVEQECS